MKLKRRTFLGSLLALTAAPAPKAKLVWEAPCVVEASYLGPVGFGHGVVDAAFAAYFGAYHAKRGSHA